MVWDIRDVTARGSRLRAELRRPRRRPDHAGWQEICTGFPPRKEAPMLLLILIILLLLALGGGGWGYRRYRYGSLSPAAIIPIVLLVLFVTGNL